MLNFRKIHLAVLRDFFLCADRRMDT